MFGVVLWSDDTQGKAVFWCEDQGDLAYFHRRDDIPETGQNFEAGDLIQFEIYLESKLRRARNPKIVREKADVDLPKKLLVRSRVQLVSPPRREPVPFIPHKPASATYQETCSA